MKINADEVITWLIIGALAGSLAGMVVKWRREGFGRLLNLAIGLIGALIDGLLFKILNINFGIVGGITVTSEDIRNTIFSMAYYRRVPREQPPVVPRRCGNPNPHLSRTPVLS